MSVKTRSRITKDYSRCELLCGFQIMVLEEGGIT